MRLGLVVASADALDLALSYRLASAALEMRHEVRIFLMHEGARLGERKEIAALVEAGAEVTVCGTSLLSLGRPPGAATCGSQLDHAALVRGCDRIVSFA